MKKILILPIFCLVFISLAFGQSDKLKQKIELQNAQFAEFTSKGDFKSAAEIYTEAGQLLPPNGETISGRDSIAGYWKATFESGIREIKVITTEVESKGKMLYELGKYEVYLPNDQLIDDGKFIVIWKQVDGKWLRHRDIWNSNRKSG